MPTSSTERTGAMTEVLLAEDDAAIAEPLARALTREGYGCVVVGDGATALEQAVDPRFELLVLDLGLPKMDGLEVCRELRNRRPDLPVQHPDLGPQLRTQAELPIHRLAQDAQLVLLAQYAHDALSSAIGVAEETYSSAYSVFTLAQGDVNHLFQTAASCHIQHGSRISVYFQNLQR